MIYKTWKLELVIFTLVEIAILMNQYIEPLLLIPEKNQFIHYFLICFSGSVFLYFFYPKKKDILNFKNIKIQRIIITSIVYLAVLLFLFLIFFNTKNDFWPIKKPVTWILFSSLIAGAFEEFFCKYVLFEFFRQKKCLLLLGFLLGNIIFVINHQNFWEHLFFYFTFSLFTFSGYLFCPSLILNMCFHFLWDIIIFFMK